MLLQRLKQYAQKRDIPPLGCARIPIRYILRIDQKGRFISLIDIATPEQKRGELFVVPDYGSRTSGNFPIVVDHFQYSLGIDIPKKNPKHTPIRHKLFNALLAACADATKEPTLEAVVKFLETFKLKDIPLPEDFDPEAKVTFEIDGVMPATLPSVQTWWAERCSTADKSLWLECLVCGEKCHPLIIWPTQIHGLPGGQPTGVAMISGQIEAAEAYGLERARYAPICATCAHECATALNMLLRQPETHTIIGDKVYVYWSDDEFSLSELMEAKPNEIDRLLSSPWRGDLELSSSPVYMAALGANAARMVMHDWIETTLSCIQQNMQRYFRLQCIVDKTGENRYFPLWQLAQLGGYGSEQALLHCALNGGKLPITMFYHVLRQIYKPPISLTQIALIKMVLLSQEESVMEEQLREIDLSSTDPAYLCGRLFRVLESIEWQAQGEISAGCKTYFQRCSRRPRDAFLKLIPRAKYHLKKLKRDKFGAFWGLNKQFCELLEHFGETFPLSFTPKESGSFILGYHHQQAADKLAAALAKEKKQNLAQLESEMQE